MPENPRLLTLDIEVPEGNDVAVVDALSRILHELALKGTIGGWEWEPESAITGKFRTQPEV